MYLGFSCLVSAGHSCRVLICWDLFYSLLHLHPCKILWEPLRQWILLCCLQGTPPPPERNPQSCLYLSTCAECALVTFSTVKAHQMWTGVWPTQTRLIPAFMTHSISSCLFNSVYLIMALCNTGWIWVYSSPLSFTAKGV